MNTFTMAMTSKNTTTHNGALSNSSTGSTILDYFARSGNCRGRNQEDVNRDMSTIMGEDPLLALKTIFYNRMVTRKHYGLKDGNVSDKVQKGQGQKDEFIKSLVYLEQNHPDMLYANLWLVPVVGCWKDLWYDSSASNFSYYICTDYVYPLIERGIQSEKHRALIAKYLPKIRSNSNITNDRHRRKNAWARGLCKYLGWSEADYRKFKSSPDNTAHLWQRQMCANEWDQINFKSIAGKALTSLVSSKGKDGLTVLKRHGIEDSYLNWIKEQPVAKFTGYPYELFMKAKNSNRSLVERYTFDAQFNQLLALAKDQVNPDLLRKGVLCALDTSGSMGSFGYYGETGSNIKDAEPIDVCVGLGIYFASLIQGAFHNHVVMFDSQSQMVQLTGESFCGKVDQVRSLATAWGGTDFQSVIDEIVRVRKMNPKIPVEDYPGVLLVVSDMQFDPSGSMETNYQTAMRKLKAVGLPEMTIIWWNVNSYGNDVPATIKDNGTVLLSGMDGAVVGTILSCNEERVIDEKTGEQRKLNPYEVMVKTLDQEVLNLLKI